MRVFRHPYTNIEIQQGAETLNIYKSEKIASKLMGVVYSFTYFFILFVVAYLIVNTANKGDAPYWEHISQKVIAFISLNLLITCFFFWGYWIFFSKHELLINTQKIRYVLSVIFPIFQYEISILEFQKISVVQDAHGFGLSIKTSGEPIYIFHFVRHKRTRNISRDASFYRNEINELNFVARTINDFVKEKKSKIKINDDLRAQIIMKRWYRTEEFPGQFVRRGKVSLWSICVSVVFLLLMMCPVSYAVLTYFHPMFLDRVDIKVVWMIRGFLFLFVPICLYFFISCLAMVIHLFKNFHIIFDACFLILSRNIFGVCYKRQQFEWQSIAFVKMQCIKKRTIQDFFRNPEGLNASINPAHCAIQLFDINHKPLGCIRDLLPNEGQFIMAILNDKIS